MPRTRTTIDNDGGDTPPKEERPGLSDGASDVSIVPMHTRPQRLVSIIKDTSLKRAMD